VTIVRTSELMAGAAAFGGGVAALNILNLEMTEGIVQAAESCGRGLILQISQNCAESHGGLAPIGRAVLEIASAATVSVAVHLDHADNRELVYEAIELGFGSVMFDGSRMPYDENRQATADVVDYSHRRGVFVEAELGEIGGKAGAHAVGVRTDPLEARTFVNDTGVDALAVAVGSSHAMRDRAASLDMDLISRIHAAVPVPLVLHGSSGVPDDQIRAAIRSGITKINFGTRLSIATTSAVRRTLNTDSEIVDPRKFMAAARIAAAEETADLLALVSAWAD
jgi:fructose-bisphosphate aldolase class II